MGVSLASVVAFGISNAFTSSAQYLGTSGGVGIGQDVSKVTVANAASLVPFLLGNLSGALGGSGLALPQLVTGLANGIATLLLSGTGTGTVVGAPSPAPATGATLSVVV